MPGGPKSADYLQPDPDILCARLEDLLMDICRIQRRKTGKFLQTCIKEAWALSHGEVKTCAQRLQAGLEHIYLKKKQLAPAVARIIKLLSKEAEASRTSKTCLQSKSPNSTRSLAWTLSQSWQHPAVPSWSPSQASAAPPDVNYKQYTCSHAVALVRLFPDGSQTTATMKVGPGSFALGCFSSEEEHESEIPNSMVLAMDPNQKSCKGSCKGSCYGLEKACQQSTC